jgi:peptidylprolyl isomerase
MTLKSILSAAVVASLAVFAACGGDSGFTTIENVTFAPFLGVDLANSTKTADGLYYRDIVVGSGNVADSGDVLQVHYTGFLADGTVFDANTAGNPPFTFTLGVSSVIAGWQEGIRGMKAGGKRQLVIPPSLGYGTTGSSGGIIPGNAVLVFSVDLVTAP